MEAMKANGAAKQRDVENTSRDGASPLGGGNRCRATCVWRFYLWLHVLVVVTCALAGIRESMRYSGVFYTGVVHYSLCAVAVISSFYLPLSPFVSVWMIVRTSANGWRWSLAGVLDGALCYVHWLALVPAYQ